MAKVNEIITNNIIEKIEKENLLPWRKPWNSFGFAHCNFFSKKPYRGLNRLITMASDYSCPYWGTFNQISKHGGQVKEGEHSTLIVFWKVVYDSKYVNTPEKEAHKFFMLRYYRVFNMEQVDGIEIPTPDVGNTMITSNAEIDAFIKQYGIDKGIEIKITGSDRACYSPSYDRIVCPKLAQYDDVAEYYSTIFHEMTHSTGHPNRLGRFDMSNMSIFGSESYSKEELVAELGSAFLRNYFGIHDGLEASAAYIKSWVKVLKDDSNMIISASGLAQKAYDFIVGEEETEEEEEGE